MAPSSATASTFSSSLFSASSLSLSRPTTRDGSDPHQNSSSSHNSAATKGSGPAKERKSSFSRKASLPGSRRRGTWTAPPSSNSSTTTSTSANGVVTDAATPPALPDYALAAAAKILPRDNNKGHSSNGKDRRDASEAPWSPVSPKDTSAMLTRTVTGPGPYIPPATPDGRPALMNSATWQLNESQLLHQQITDVAQKRISTLDYLRKAHEGRVYWFNTYLFDKPDLARMPGFDPRKLSRKATNYLLLGLSIPTIHDLYSSTPLEFLRCLNSLLSEFDSFQQLHGDSSSSSASLTRARLPNMFRRPAGKSRRSTSASTDVMMDDASAFSHPSLAMTGSSSGSGNGSGGSGAGQGAPAVMNFAASESDLLPGEEYTYLLTPSLPFDPDFFETFATLCDVLIDCYTRFLALVPTPRECSGPIAELFTKADSKMRKIIVQGVVKDFEDHSRTHVKSEVAGIGKVVLGGLM